MERRQLTKIRSNSKKRSELLNRKNWSQLEDEILTKTRQQLGSNWRQIALHLVGRNPSQCAQRWKRMTYNQKIQKNKKWTQEEDDLLLILQKKYQDKWNLIALELGNRSGRQVRERYINHLDPNLSKSKWTKKEDLLIWEAFQQYGSQWTKIGKLVPGRSENMIKNRYYSYLRKTFGNLENPYYQITKEQEQDNKNFEIFADKKYKSKLRKYEEKFECDRIKNQIQIKNFMDDYEEENIHAFYNNYSFEEMCCTQSNIFSNEQYQFTQESPADYIQNDNI